LRWKQSGGRHQVADLEQKMSQVVCHAQDCVSLRFRPMCSPAYHWRSRLRHRLDTIDMKILAQLQADGSITNVELARRVGISAPPCLRRVKALEEAGLIKGYRALLDSRQLGFGVSCFAMVQLKSTTKVEIDAFETRIRSWDAVRESWTLSGDIDLMLKCVFPNLEAFQAFVSELTALPNLASVRTALALSKVKDEPTVPFERAVAAG
jgi:DNA-binding Lrp family transcriptional regulator